MNAHSPILARKRRLWLLVPAAILLLACVHSAVWVWVCAEIQSRYAAVQTQAAAEGWRLTAQPPSRAGWPFRAAMRYPAWTAHGAELDIPGGVTLDAEALELGVEATRPKMLQARLLGQLRLRAGAAPAIPIQAQNLQANLALDGTAPPELVAEDLVATLPALRITARHAVLRATVPANAGTALAATLAITGIVLPDEVRRAMGGDIEQLALRAVMPRLPPQGPTPAARAAAWRQAGGVLELPELALQWGALRLTGQASLRLDAKLQPDASGTLDVAGHAEALDALVRGGVLPARTALAAKAVLGLLARPAQGGPVSLPVQLQDGVLVVARFPLLRLPPLDWGPP